MKILAINCGSSSIKYKLYKFPQKILIAKGNIEKIGEKNSKIKNHYQGIRLLISLLKKKNIIKNIKDISGVGHRVVHGGDFFQKPQKITAQVIKKIKECSPLAPLHNPANLAGIISLKKISKHLPQVAVFDTSFYHTLPDYVRIYPIPIKYYKKYRIKKYGFHGLSHQFMAERISHRLGRPLNRLKIITCHLGNGCSITALDRGKVLDTSMGFTPLEGLMMGSRCGDVDIGAVFYIMEKEKKNCQQMRSILNRKSGLLGISGISNDLRLIKKNIKKKYLAKLSLEMFIYRIKKYIGAFSFILGKLDAVGFSGGIGENHPDIINKLKRSLYKIFPQVKIMVIPANEELVIAETTYKLIKRRGL